MAKNKKTQQNNSKEGLSRQKIVEVALALADDIGIDGLTMRKLADTLDSAPMTLYYHISSKDKLINAMVEQVFSEITSPPEDREWKEAIRIRCHSARTVLNCHWWAPPLMESRSMPGPETLKHHNSVLACLRRAGFSVQLTAHAYAVIDSYLYGFTFEEANLPSSDDGSIKDIGKAMTDKLLQNGYDYIAELTSEIVLKQGYSFGASFDFGLDLLLDGLEREMKNSE